MCTLNNVVVSRKIQSNRNKSLDVAKGLLMISVVAGHIANFPFGEVFYFYHVAGFFLLSGFFFNYNKYATSILSFILSRKKIIIQYVGYSLLFIFLHNYFTHLNIQPINTMEYASSDYVTAIITSITIPTEPLSGAMWFIPVLVIMQIVFYIINRVTTPINRKGDFLSVLVIVLFFIGWWLVKGKYISENQDLNKYIPNAQFFVYLPFFYVGFLFKNKGLELLKSSRILIPCFAIMAMSYISLRPTLYLYGEVDPFLFISLSFISIAFIIGISYHINYTPVVNMLKFIGENTLHILALHFLFFKLGTLILICLGKLPSSALHDIGAPSDGEMLANLVYFVCGVFGPLLVVTLYSQIKKIIFR
ncbi:acyltransferase [Citrobacter sp. Marseille-Q3906]|uniref:acyltransferase family protein n=1 Tax=Citrobacter sp. Marseille-Q3906 TaxID=2866574 RepID=UPI001CE437FA|nr:acyltransferase [Citrobacter sp. Marseille-Q3906]